MKGLAICILPSKNGETAISYCELNGPTKDKIKIGRTDTIGINNNGVEKISSLVRSFTSKIGTIIPVVFGAHEMYQGETSKLDIMAEEMFVHKPLLQVHHRWYYDSHCWLDKVNPVEINLANERFGVALNFDEEFTDQQDDKLNRIAGIFASEYPKDIKMRFIGLLPSNDYIIRILEKGGKWKERFGIHLCRHLGGDRNICVKPLGVNPNPPFSDVVATYIGDMLDTETGEEPRIVEAIR